MTMLIWNQNRDKTFTLTDKGLLRSKIYVEKKWCGLTLMGWNVMGKNLFRTVLLGTYDKDEAYQLGGEVNRFCKLGMASYIMPESALDLDDMEALYEE
jgi:hypothetical protein